jgi:hypothetical protein
MDNEAHHRMIRVGTSPTLICQWRFAKAGTR